MSLAVHRTGLSDSYVRKAVRNGHVAGQRTPLGLLVKIIDVDRWAEHRKPRPGRVVSA